MLDGMERYQLDHGIQFHGVQPNGEHPHPGQARLLQSLDVGAFQVAQSAHLTTTKSGNLERLGQSRKKKTTSSGSTRRPNMWRSTSFGLSPQCGFRLDRGRQY
jgi:hypothetical protein